MFESAGVADKGSACLPSTLTILGDVTAAGIDDVIFSTIF